jgi:hypothetical protein
MAARVADLSGEKPVDKQTGVQQPKARCASFYYLALGVPLTVRGPFQGLEQSGLESSLREFCGKHRGAGLRLACLKLLVEGGLRAIGGSSCATATHEARRSAVLVLCQSRLRSIAWDWGTGSLKALGKFCGSLAGFGTSCNELMSMADYFDAADQLMLSVLQKSASYTEISGGVVPQARTSPVHGFWHIASFPNDEFWRLIATDQWWTIRTSGLDAISETVSVTVLGEGNVSFPSGNFDVAYGGRDVSKYEFATLRKLEKRCREQPDGLVWYIHNKGASIPSKSYDNAQPVMDWRHFMEYFVITRHEDCIDEILKAGYDTCGVHLVNSTARFYGGNM